MLQRYLLNNNITTTWITIDDIEGYITNRNYKGRDCESLVNIFKYWQPFGLHFWYRHEVDDHHNRCHSPILPKSKWDTDFWSDINFAWYVAAREINKTLASRNFHDCNDIISTLYFCRKLEIY